jgi:predicted dehydrogenase
MLRVAVVGLGKRSQRYAIPYFLRDNTLQLAAVCDSSKSTTERFKSKFADALQVPSFANVSAMIASSSIDCAYVAVPHYLCADIVQKLLASKIHVLREKPAAMTALELKLIQDLARSNDVTFSTASQFRHSEQFRQMEEWLPLIGKIHFAEGIRKIPVRDLGAGWRASRVLSGGGVLIDLGWHLVDLMVTLLSDGSVPGVQDAKLFQTRPSQPYDCEDTARAILNVHNSKLSARSGSIPCSLFITRLGPNKAFQLTVYGDSGSLRMDGDVVELNLLDKSEMKSFSKITPGLNLSDIVVSD